VIPAAGFPEAHKDPVIQIASLVTVQGDTYPTIKNILTLGTCDPIADSEVIAFEREADLLRAWSDLVKEVDPDVITGYSESMWTGAQWVSWLTPRAVIVSRY
jgi:DNA polymerase delta subunit 1